MFGIRKTFRRLFGRGAADAFNSVVAYLNNLCGDESIDFHRPDSPSAENPPCIAVSKTWLNTFLSAFAAAYAAGVPGETALAFANLASSVTVKKIGATGTASPDEILRAFDRSFGEGEQ